MKIRWSIEDCPKPKGIKYYLICLICERIDILCRLIVQKAKED